MGPYLLINTALIGAFVLLAVHHFVLWWHARDERSLILFAAHNAVGALHSYALVGLATAHVVPLAQSALNVRTTAGLLSVITGPWLAASLAGVRGYWFRVPLAALATVAAFVNVFWTPLNGSVIGIETLTLPWGESLSYVHHTREKWLVLYVVMVASCVFVSACGVSLWRRDRAGGVVLTSVGAFATAIAVLAALRDVSSLAIPYPGSLPYALWGLLVSRQIGWRHRRNAEALRENEARLRALSENLPNSMTYQVVRERDGSMRFVFVSPSVELLHGVSVEQVLRDRGLLYRQIREEDRAALDRAEAESLRTMSVFEVVVQFRRSNGAVRWGRLASAPRRLHDGRVLWDGIETDITESKLAEEALRESEERNRLILQEVKDYAIFMLDPDGIVVTWNAGAQRVSGYYASEILGKSHAIFYLPDEAAAGVPQLNRERACREGGFTDAGWRLRKSGSRAWMDGSLTPLRGRDHQLVGFAVVGRDRTEIKRSESMWRSVVDTTVEGVITIDRGQFIQFINAAGANMFGYAGGELVGQRIERLLPEFALALRDSTTAQPGTDASGAGSLDQEVVGLRQNGKPFPIELGMSEWSFDENRYLTLLIRDISQRKSLEKQLRQAQKMEALGRLAGGVAHDFNNLLTVIGGYSHILLAGSMEPNARTGLEQIRDAGERASSLTRQLLAFSRQSMLEPRVLDLNDVVRDAEGMLRRLIGEDIALVVAFAGHPCPVRADPDQLGQVLINLAVNSRDAMPRGGTLSINTRCFDVEREYADRKAGRYVTLTVCDNGSGMLPEVRSRLFEPFFTTKGPGTGTGLGLAVVHGIVEQSKGFIDVDSEPGHGTTFRICLPLEARKQSSAACQEPAPNLHRGHETVMLVEDEAAVRNLMQRTLEDCGFQVLVATNGEEAKRVVAEHLNGIDLLLTDVVMPGMSGRELADSVRRQRPGLPVVFTSGYTDDMVLRHGVSEGEVNLLRKPFTPDVLTTKVRQVLDARPF